MELSSAVSLVLRLTGLLVGIPVVVIWRDTARRFRTLAAREYVGLALPADTAVVATEAKPVLLVDSDLGFPSWKKLSVLGRGGNGGRREAVPAICSLPLGESPC